MNAASHVYSKAAALQCIQRQHIHVCSSVRTASSSSTIIPSSQRILHVRVYPFLHAVNNILLVLVRTGGLSIRLLIPRYLLQYTV